MCSGNALIGPPEARGTVRDPPISATDSEILGSIAAVDSEIGYIAEATGEPFLDIIDAGFNSTQVEENIDEAPPLMGRTENNSATYLSTGNPCLDFFFQIVPNIPAADVASLLAAAWQSDALTALKLVCNLRGVRGTGKSDKESFYAAAIWIHTHHPKTLALNVASFAEFGYMKDLLEILYRLIHGADACFIDRRHRLRESRRRFSISRKSNREATKARKEIPRDERIAAELKRLKMEMEWASSERLKKKGKLAFCVIERYNRDPDYRFLHDRISELFATLLTADLEQLRLGQVNKIGLAAKWCPSLDSSFDRSTLLCESIARRIFPSGAGTEYADVPEEYYAYRIRDRLRREVLVPLRKALELPELYVSSRRWSELPYNRVASVAMKNYKSIFAQHDKVRFEEYLKKVKEGKAKIAAGAVLPHQIAGPALRGEHDEVAELQWRRMVEDLLHKGNFSNCLAVCDVSGSMSGTPMDVCVAMGLLVSELCEEPWKGRVITFSANPQIHMIQGDTLKEKSSFVKEMDWGCNTDFQKVFDVLLALAVEGKLPPEKMVKSVFVFSDMEFDKASANSWETDYKVIRSKFFDAGYAEVVPEIVFWNLRASRSIPTAARQEGVALVSGFSKNVMKLFLEGGGIVDPVSVMDIAISGEEYQKLAVFD